MHLDEIFGFWQSITFRHRPDLVGNRRIQNISNHPKNKAEDHQSIEQDDPEKSQAASAQEEQRGAKGLRSLS